MTDTKPAYQSLTIQGGAIALIASKLPAIAPPLFRAFGMDPGLVPDATNALIEAFGLFGALMVFYGRARATTKLA